MWSSTRSLAVAMILFQTLCLTRGSLDGYLYPEDYDDPPKEDKDYQWHHHDPKLPRNDQVKKSPAGKHNSAGKHDPTGNDSVQHNPGSPVKHNSVDSDQVKHNPTGSDSTNYDFVDNFPMALDTPENNPGIHYSPESKTESDINHAQTNEADLLEIPRGLGNEPGRDGTVNNVDGVLDEPKDTYQPAKSLGSADSQGSIDLIGDLPSYRSGTRQSRPSDADSVMEQPVLLDDFKPAHTNVRISDKRSEPIKDRDAGDHKGNLPQPDHSFADHRANLAQPKVDLRYGDHKAGLPQGRDDRRLGDAGRLAQPQNTGSYCLTRPGQTCCTGRNDECSVPYHDTLCYCDIFCDRSGSDCCPDFEATCGALVNKRLSDNSGGQGQGQDSDAAGSRYASDLRENGGRGLKDGRDEVNSDGRIDWEYDQGISDNTRDGIVSHDHGQREQGHSSNHPTVDGLPNNCRHRGRLYQPGDGIKENCNNCTCVNAVLKKEYNWKCTQKICLIRPELLDHVSNTESGWQAQNYSFFWGLSADDGARYKLGTFKPTDSVNRMTMLNVRVDDQLPQQFDAREHWPGLISPIVDQGLCSASWAISTTGVASDRLRIHSGGAYDDVTLSSEHLISCDTEQHGCAPGHVDRAWWFMRKVGLVSDQCYPFTSGQIKRDQSGSSGGSCPLPRSYETLKTSRCPRPGVPLTVYRASPPYKIAPNEREIMKELMTNGPLQAIMEVKEDFFMYKSGVYSFSLPAEYQTDSERKNHYHSVRIIGWGVDRSNPNKELKYWICANSWGTAWGEDGYFRILRGTDESSIESHVVGVWLKVNDRMLIQRRNHRGGANNNRGGVNERGGRRHARHPRHHRGLHQHKNQYFMFR